MRLVLRHARAMTVELLRYPAYLVPTLLLPTVFFLFFVSPGPRQEATVRMATFAGFAVIGVAFFQFGVGIAIDRASPWEAYLRTLPVGPSVRLAARLASAAVFAVRGCRLLLILTAVVTTGASLPADRWVELASALLAGIVPFAFLGIALGYWAPSKGALPIANLLYLVLSYLGGLWILPFAAAGARGHGLAVPADAGARRTSSSLRPAAGRSTGAPGSRSRASPDCSPGSRVAGYRRDEGRRFS